MGRKKEPRQNGVSPEIGDEHGRATQPSTQSARRAWHAILKAILKHDDEIQLAVQSLLLDSPSGHAFLDYVKEFRPRIGDGPILEFLAIVKTYEGLELLEKLKAEPRFGADPNFSIWKEFWHGSRHGPSYAYEDLIEFSLVMEKKAATEEERGRIRGVREAIERELQERTQKAAPSGRIGSLGEATADWIREPETPLGKELKRILAHLEKPGALPDTKPVPDVDWADFVSWHPAFRDIYPGG